LKLYLLDVVVNEVRASVRKAPALVSLRCTEQASIHGDSVRCLHSQERRGAFRYFSLGWSTGSDQTCKSVGLKISQVPVMNWFRNLVAAADTYVSCSTTPDLTLGNADIPNSNKSLRKQQI